MKPLMNCLLLSLALAGATAAHAAPELSLDAQARAEVENDEMTVVLSVDADGPQVQALTQSALATLQRASGKAKRTPGVDIRVGNINTYPVWGAAVKGKGKISSWHLRADLTLKSTDFAALGLLASELTSELQITNVDFALSPARRAVEEGKLMTAVAQSFKAKASALGQALGYPKFGIKAVQFNQQFGGGGGRPMPMMMAMKGASMSADAVPVPTDGGKSDVVVTMSGTVELEN